MSAQFLVSSFKICDKDLTLLAKTLGFKRPSGKNETAKVGIQVGLNATVKLAGQYRLLMLGEKKGYIEIISRFLLYCEYFQKMGSNIQLFRAA